MSLLEDPLPSFRFFVTLDPADLHLPADQAAAIPFLATAGFSDVSGLAGELEVMAHAEGGVNDFVHQLPVRHTWGRITLKRGFVRDNALWEWYRAGLTRSIGARRDGAVVLMTPGITPAAAWVWRGGLVSKWSSPDMNANSSAVAVESIEVTHQGLEHLILSPPGTE